MGQPPDVISILPTPEMKFAPVILILLCSASLAITSADVLQNPDFELPPSKWAPNSTVPSVPLNENNTIPGWTTAGTVQYVTAGPQVSLPQNQHAILLAENGKINQSFTANGDVMRYLITFSLSTGGINCATNVSLVVSAPDNDAEFSVKQSYSKDPWQIYGHQLGSWGNGESINLVLESQTIDTGSNATTCWPVVDKLVVKPIGSTRLGNQANVLRNGGFESGPAFLDSSSQGVLLDPEPSLTESALQDWAVTGTVRYIDSKNYFIPEGNAAVEIVSGDAAGIQTAKTLVEGSGYNLQFMLGDANDSCIGDLTVGVQAGSSVQNFTVQSKGTGSAMKYAMTFKAGSSPAPISFRSYTVKQSTHGIFCGPVVDGVVLSASNGQVSNSRSMLPVTLLLLLIALLFFGLYHPVSEVSHSD